MSGILSLITLTCRREGEIENRTQATFPKILQGKGKSVILLCFVFSKKQDCSKVYIEIEITTKVTHFTLFVYYN